MYGAVILLAALQVAGVTATPTPAPRAAWRDESAQGWRSIAGAELERAKVRQTL